MNSPTKHVETMIVPGLRLGRRPRDPARQVLKLGDYLTGNLPDYPSAIDYFAKVPTWILGGNNRFGTCGPTALANLLLLTTTWLSDTPVTVTDTDVYDLYRRSNNPDFDPATGVGDNGVDLTVMLSAALKDGIGGRKPLAFASVHPGDPGEMWAVGALFGGAILGTDLSVAQQDQTKTGLWDHAPNTADWGGHAVMAAGRYGIRGAGPDRTGLVSWARVLDSTDDFLNMQAPERYVVIFEEHLGSRQFLQGVDLAALAADYQTLTHRVFPAPVPVPRPAPAPTPSPTPPIAPPSSVSAADLALAEAIPHGWLTEWHIGGNGEVRDALVTWLVATGITPPPGN